MTVNGMASATRLGYLLCLVFNSIIAYADPREIGPDEIKALETPHTYYTPNVPDGFYNCFLSESEVVDYTISYLSTLDFRCDVWDEGPTSSWVRRTSPPYEHGNLNCLDVLGLSRAEHGYTESRFRGVGRITESPVSGCSMEDHGRLLYYRSAFYYCPEYSTAYNFRDDSSFSYTYCKTHYYITPEPDNCANEGNPCNPASGNKYQVETDIPHDGKIPGLTRYYHSQGSSDDSNVLGSGWTHHYQRLVDVADSSSYQQLFRIKSNVYTTPSQACSEGWLDIRERAFRGLYANQVAYLRSDNVCHISNTNTRMRIHPTLKVSPLDHTHTVSRPNGKTITFIQNSDDWVEMNGALGNFTPFADGWLFKDKNGTIETYNSEGRLLKTTSATGENTTLSYDPEGRLETVTGNFGHTLTFHYDEAGHLVTIVTPEGDLGYGYDTEGRLNRVTYIDGSERHYHYEDSRYPYHLTGITDEKDERYATWAYDDQGRAILSEHANGAERVEFTYNPDGTTTVADANGAERIYHFTVQQGQMKVDHIEGDRCATCAHGGVQSYTYDANGFVASQTDWNGHVITYTRDAQGRELSRTEGAGTPEASTVTTTWDTELNKPLSVIEPERIIEYHYSSEGRLLGREERSRS